MNKIVENAIAAHRAKNANGAIPAATNAVGAVAKNAKISVGDDEALDDAKYKFNHAVELAIEAVGQVEYEMTEMQKDLRRLYSAEKDKLSRAAEWISKKSAEVAACITKVRKFDADLNRMSI